MGKAVSAAAANRDFSPPARYHRRSNSASCSSRTARWYASRNSFGGVNLSAEEELKTLDEQFSSLEKERAEFEEDLGVLEDQRRFLDTQRERLRLDTEAFEAERDALLLPTWAPVDHMRRIQLDDGEDFYFCRGQSVMVDATEGEALAFAHTRFLGLGCVDDERQFHPKRVMVSSS